MMLSKKSLTESLEENFLILNEEGEDMRLKYLDLTKGFAIILMIFGHALVKINGIHIWIYSFHMPIFFIICGIIISLKEEQSKTSKKNGAIKRVITIGIPYLIFGLILALFYGVLEMNSNGLHVIQQKIFALFTLQGIDSLWFLPVYVLAEAFVIISSKIKPERYKFINRCFILILLFSIIYNFQNFFTTWYLKVLFKILLGICFVLIGTIISKIRVVENESIVISILFLIIGCILAELNGPVEMVVSNIGNIWLYFSSATFTSIAILSFFKRIESKKNIFINFFEVYGRSTIVLLVTNNLIIEIIRLLDYKFLGNCLIQLGLSGSLILTIIILFIEWWIIKMSRGRFGFVFGYIGK